MSSFKKCSNKIRTQIEIQYELQELMIKNSKKIYNENKKCKYESKCNVGPCDEKKCPYVTEHPHAEFFE